MSGEDFFYMHIMDKRVPAPSKSAPITMPSQSTITKVRLNNILTGLNGAVNTLELFATSFNTPFLTVISSTVCSLQVAMQVRSPLHISRYDVIWSGIECETKQE
jgi:hypothetical protein